ncbi:hypothetical protein OUZ56_018521 [Daphnia magna]|uniref:Uncharacterized protein n=1 Tax=Daphnia magna TaxID=35525 RepID=A0ABQ9Z927_9CRUS|nr:hypothetical protein OUZ56_018521 [Daphnia magna]
MIKKESRPIRVPLPSTSNLFQLLKTQMPRSSDSESTSGSSSASSEDSRRSNRGYRRSGRDYRRSEAGTTGDLVPGPQARPDREATTVDEAEAPRLSLSHSLSRSRSHNLIRTWTLIS